MGAVPIAPADRLDATWHSLTRALDRLQISPVADHRTFLALARHARLKPLTVLQLPAAARAVAHAAEQKQHTQAAEGDLQ